MLFPKPLLTIISVSPSANIPDVYFGNNPCPGATTPPIKGSRNCPPWACPARTQINSIVHIDLKQFRPVGQEKFIYASVTGYVPDSFVHYRLGVPVFRPCVKCRILRSHQADLLSSQRKRFRYSIQDMNSRVLHLTFQPDIAFRCPRFVVACDKINRSRLVTACDINSICLPDIRMI